MGAGSNPGSENWGTEGFSNGMNLGPAPVDSVAGNSAITMGLLDFYANPITHTPWWQPSLTKDNTLEFRA